MTDLEEEMVTFYSAVMQNIRNEKGELDPFLTEIGRYFLMLTRRGNLCPSTVRVLVTALGDMADVFQQKTKQLFVGNTQTIRPEWSALFQRSDVFNTAEEMQSLRYAQQMIKAVL